MAKKTNVLVTPTGRSDVPSEGDISPVQRKRMVREAKQQPPETVETTELGVQGSGLHGFRQDDALKRIIKQHPQKGIPQVESIEPQEAPPKE